MDEIMHALATSPPPASLGDRVSSGASQWIEACVDSYMAHFHHPLPSSWKFGDDVADAIELNTTDTSTALSQGQNWIQGIDSLGYDCSGCDSVNTLIYIYLYPCESRHRT